MPTITAQMLKASIDGFEKDGKPGEQWSYLKTVLLHAYQRLDDQEKALRWLVQQLKGIGMPAQTVEGAPAAAPAAPTAPRGGVRIGADGQPLEPHQAAIEEQMDAAIGAMGSDAAPAPRQQAPNAPQAAAPQAPLRGRRDANGQRLGADGTPLDAVQSAAEDAMDAAMGL